MQIADINNPGERKKLIWAMALGLVALIFLWWTFFGFGGSSKPTANRNTRNANQTPRNATAPENSTALNPEPIQPAKDELKSPPLDQLRPVVCCPPPPSVGEARRNIFIYYEAPPKPTPVEAPPTPTPTPPMLLAAVSPSNVYAKTEDFALEATGDRFTGDVRIMFEGRELPTRFVSPQQLSATVPAAMIANAGARPIIVRSSDGSLFSNEVILNVNPAPVPNYTYIGIIGTVKRLDTAIVQDKGSREILNLQRGDVVGGRFRLTSISEKELVFVDTTLKIKHPMPMSTDQNKGFGPQSRPTPKVDSEDDEP
jgi:hypothetical protein